MERGSLESETQLSGAQSAEVLGGSWDHVTTSFKDDAAGGLTTNGHVEVALWERPIQ